MLFQQGLVKMLGLVIIPPCARLKFMILSSKGGSERLWESDNRALLFMASRSCFHQNFMRKCSDLGEALAWNLGFKSRSFSKRKCQMPGVTIIVLRKKRSPTALWLQLRWKERIDNDLVIVALPYVYPRASSDSELSPCDTVCGFAPSSLLCR